MESFYFFQDTSISLKISRLKYLCLLHKNVYDTMMRGEKWRQKENGIFASSTITSTIRLPLSCRETSWFFITKFVVTFVTHRNVRETSLFELFERSNLTKDTRQEDKLKQYTLNNVQNSPRSQTQQSPTFLFQEKGLA